LFSRQKESKWAISTLQNSRPDKFIKSLKIPEWSYHDFWESLSNIFSSDVPKIEFNTEWIKKQKDRWLQDLYLLIQKTFDRLGEEDSYLRYPEIKIFPLDSGEIVTADEAHIPTEGRNKDFPQLRKGILYHREKKRREKIIEILKAMGVKEIDRRKKLELLIDKYYSYGADEPSLKQHPMHMKSFINWWKDGEEIDFLKKSRLFYNPLSKIFCEPENFYIDRPFKKTSLSLIYGPQKKDESLQKVCMWPGYRKIKPREDFINFAVSLGVLDKIKIERKTVSYQHPEYTVLMEKNYGRRTYTGTDEDYTIEGLSSILAMKKRAVSKMIWDTIRKEARQNRDILEARYAPNQSYKTREARSTFVHVLRSHAWIPGKKRGFYKPSEMTREKLPGDFAYDNANNWLEKIDFGMDDKKKTQEYQEMEKKANEIGMPVVKYEKYMKLSAEKREEFWKKVDPILSDVQKEGKRQEPKTNYIEELLSREKLQKRMEEQSPADGYAANPVRRRAKIKQDIENDMSRSIESRFRRIPAKKWEAKNFKVRQFLKEQYQGKCQICSYTFPKKNGEWYFEGLYLVSRTKTAWLDRPGNVLCLCANCCAKFEYGSLQGIETFIEQVESYRCITEGGKGEPVFSLQLCGENVNLKFSEKHLIDLQEILKTVRGKKKVKKKAG
jgi:hypothetical protein